MIRFVDLTEAYWAGDAENMRESPCCAFLNTVTDRFVKAGDCHTFDYAADLDLIEDEELRERCRALVPKRFWKGGYWPNDGHCHACGDGDAVYCAKCSDAWVARYKGAWETLAEANAYPQAKLEKIRAVMTRSRSGEYNEHQALRDIWQVLA